MNTKKLIELCGVKIVGEVPGGGVGTFLAGSIAGGKGEPVMNPPSEAPFCVGPQYPPPEPKPAPVIPSANSLQALGNWAQFHVIPALDQLAENLDKGFFPDLTYLAALGELLPDGEKEAWRTLVRRLEDQACEYLGLGTRHAPLIARFFKAVRYFLWPRVSAQIHAFAGVLNGLNEHWFLPRRFFLFRSRLGPRFRVQTAPKHGNKPLARLQLGVAYVHQHISADCIEGAIPIIFARVCDDLPGFSGFFDKETGYVFLDQNDIVREVLRAELVAQGNPTFLRYCRAEKKAMTPAECRRNQLLWQNYPKLFQSLIDRTCFEEVRHAIDSRRAGDTDLPFREYYDHLGRGLLHPKGRLRALLWSAANPAEDLELLGADLLAGKVITELSAHLTAAACGSPQLVLLEWWQFFEDMKSAPAANQLSIVARAPNHAAAFLLGMLLLCEQFHLEPCLTAKEFFQPDFPALADKCKQLLLRNANEIRLALKAAFQAEFSFPIDEQPFAEITAEGNLRRRPGVWHDLLAQSPTEPVNGTPSGPTQT
jgi:hypothetical protein